MPQKCPVLRLPVSLDNPRAGSTGAAKAVCSRFVTEDAAVWQAGLQSRPSAVATGQARREAGAVRCLVTCSPYSSRRTGKSHKENVVWIKKLSLFVDPRHLKMDAGTG